MRCWPWWCSPWSWSWSWSWPRGGQGRGVGVGQLVLPPGWSKSASVNPPAVHQFAELSGPTTILPSTNTPLKSASVNPPAVHQFAELSGPTTILPSTSTPLKSTSVNPPAMHQFAELSGPTTILPSTSTPLKSASVNPPAVHQFAELSGPTTILPSTSTPLKSASVNPPAMHQFAELSGPTTILPSTSTPLKFLEQIFGADFFEVFAVATNINATVVSPPCPDQAAGQYATSDVTWKPTSAEEMRAFVAINMAMGINQSPEYKDAWSVDPIARNGFISSVMSRTRYEKLSQYMHCSVASRQSIWQMLCYRQTRTCVALHMTETSNAATVHEFNI